MPCEALRRWWMDSHRLAGDPLQIARRLLRCDPRLETSHHVTTPADSCVDVEFGAGQAQRDPQLAAGQTSRLQWELKAPRHHSDNFVKFSVELKLGSENSRIPVQAVLPERVADHGDLLLLVILLLREPAAH